MPGTRADYQNEGFETLQPSYIGNWALRLRKKHDRLGAESLATDFSLVTSVPPHPSRHNCSTPPALIVRGRLAACNASLRNITSSISIAPRWPNMLTRLRKKWSVQTRLAWSLHCICRKTVAVRLHAIAELTWP